MLRLDKAKPIQNVKYEKKEQKIIRALWLAVGLVCVGLGAIGIVLPILPTTPFLLAAAACFCKSSTRMYDWLLSNRWFGEYIRNYREVGGFLCGQRLLRLRLCGLRLVFQLFFC